MIGGICKICGCTEEHACEGGCGWADAEQTICTQCVGWVVLNDHQLYGGVFPFGVVPIRNVVPDVAWNHHTGKATPVFWVDVRRLDETTVERIAFIMAEVNGNLAEDALEALRGGKPIPLDVRCAKFGLSANTPEEACVRAEEIAATGTVVGAKEVRIQCITVEAANEGGSHRG